MSVLPKIKQKLLVVVWMLSSCLLFEAGADPRPTVILAQTPAELCQARALKDSDALVIPNPKVFAIGGRGFLGPYPEFNSANEAVLAEYGIDWWYTSAFLVKDRAGIVRHQLTNPDAITDAAHGQVYFLHPNADPDNLTKIPRDDVVTMLREALERGQVFVPKVERENGNIGRVRRVLEIMQIDKAIAQAVFIPEQAQLTHGIGLFGNHVRFPGLTAPETTGGLAFAEIADSTTLGKVAKAMEAFIAEGGQLIVNTNDLARFEEAMLMLRNQQRRGRIYRPVLDLEGREQVDGNGFLRLQAQAVELHESTNRFADPVLVKAMTDGFKEKRVQVYEVRGPAGHLLALTLVRHRVGTNSAVPETIGYAQTWPITVTDERGKEKVVGYSLVEPREGVAIPDWARLRYDTIEHAKMSAGAMLADLGARGIVAIDAEMATPFSAGVLGVRVVNRATELPQMMAVMPRRGVGMLHVDRTPETRLGSAVAQAQGRTNIPWYERISPPGAYTEPKVVFHLEGTGPKLWGDAPNTEIPGITDVLQRIQAQNAAHTIREVTDKGRGFFDAVPTAEQLPDAIRFLRLQVELPGGSEEAFREGIEAGRFMIREFWEQPQPKAKRTREGVFVEWMPQPPVRVASIVVEWD